MNDVALAQMVVIAVRLAAMRELKLNGEGETPILQTVLEFAGQRMAADGPCARIDAACQYKEIKQHLCRGSTNS